ncbi:SIMPL domain-containing protein [Cytobacillus sp. Hz8]|uniref:SIMPL domain-containing protein n=1 Tax=Cytobacillus sp. Hz8 TaxID=3347168 RepID=UPI0035D9991A
MQHFRGYPYYQKTTRSESFTMKVIGEGIVNAQPDEANIILGVSTEHRELKKAQSDNAEIIQKVQTALQKIGITADDIRTTEYSIYPQYDYVDNKQIFRGYKVDHLLNITVSDIQNVGAVVDTAVTNGANTIRNIEFSLSNPDAFYKRALTLAMNNALDKAETLAGSLNIQLIKTPLSISEIMETKPIPIPFATFQNVKAATTTPIAPGKLQVRSMIQAIFCYYQK